MGHSGDGGPQGHPCEPPTWVAYPRQRAGGQLERRAEAIALYFKSVGEAAWSLGVRRSHGKRVSESSPSPILADVDSCLRQKIVALLCLMN